MVQDFSHQQYGSKKSSQISTRGHDGQFRRQIGGVADPSGEWTCWGAAFCLVNRLRWIGFNRLGMTLKLLELEEVSWLLCFFCVGRTFGMLATFAILMNILWHTFETHFTVHILGSNRFSQTNVEYIHSHWLLHGLPYVGWDSQGFFIMFPHSF